METYNMNLQDVVSIMYVYTRKKQKSVAAKQWLCHVVWLIGKGRRKKQVHAKFCICHLVIYMMTFICYFDTSGITCIVSEYYVSCITRCNTYIFFFFLYRLSSVLLYMYPKTLSTLWPKTVYLASFEENLKTWLRSIS